MNGLQSISEWKDYFGKPTGSVLGVVNAAQSIGSVLSLPFVGIMSDRIGRRLTLLSGAIVIVIALIIQAASVNYGMFVFARVLVGVGSMLVVQPSPMLITELAYPTHRGKYTSAFWTMYYLGAYPGIVGIVRYSEAPELLRLELESALNYTSRVFTRSEYE